MIERDPIYLDCLVESHQDHLKQDWQAANAGPGPIRLALARRLIQLGETLGGKHAEIQDRRLATPDPVGPILIAR